MSRPTGRPATWAARHVAPRHPHREAERAAVHQHVGQHARHDAHGQAPVDLEGEEGHRTDHRRCGDRVGGRLVETGRVAHRAFHHVGKDTDRDVVDEQTGDGRVDAAAMLQEADRGDQHPAGEHSRQGHDDPDHRHGGGRAHQPGGGRRQAPQHQRPFAANVDDAHPGGQGGTEGRQEERRRPREGVLPSGVAAEASPIHPVIQRNRTHVREQHHERAEHEQRRYDGRQRDPQGFRQSTPVHAPPPKEESRRSLGFVHEYLRLEAVSKPWCRRLACSSCRRAACTTGVLKRLLSRDPKGSAGRLRSPSGRG